MCGFDFLHSAVAKVSDLTNTLYAKVWGHSSIHDVSTYFVIAACAAPQEGDGEGHSSEVQGECIHY